MREDETYRQERPVVYLIGIGMGGEDQLTGQAIDRLEGARGCHGSRQDVRFRRAVYTGEAGAYSL